MKTKLHIVFTIIFLSVVLNETIAKTWEWTKGAGGTNLDDCRGIATDANGNVFSIGYFYSPSITFGTTTLTNVGSSDMFIVKYDAGGNVLWTQSAGGTGDDNGLDITADTNGNVIVTGYFNSASITFGTTTLMNAGSWDMFIVKYDTGGNVLWAKSAGGTSDDIGHGIASDANGNVVVTGRFYSSSISFGTITLTNAGSEDMFIVKYNAVGNVLWAKSSGGSNTDIGFNVATDANGNVFVTGYFWSSSIIFGTDILTNAGAGASDMFIVKYDAAGTTLWAKSAGGTDRDYGFGVAADTNGNVVLTGNFNSPSITFGATILTNAGNSDMFIVKYDAGGNVLWVKSAGGTGDDYGFEIAADANSNMFVIGYFYSPSITFGTTTLTNNGISDIFIVKYDAGGNELWVKSAGGTDGDYGFAVATDANQNVFVTGRYDSPSITFGTTTLINAGPSDIFIVKLDGNTTGLVERYLENETDIFPNPFSGQTTLRAGIALHKATLTVTNCTGQTVAQIKNISGHTITFNRNNLANGLYFIQLTQDNKVVTTKKINITD